MIKNSGTKKWKHVKLVYQGGLKPATLEVDVPELKPGEKTEIKVQYPPISAKEPDFVKRFVYVREEGRMQLHTGCCRY